MAELRAEAVRDRYRHAFGQVPRGIEQRLTVARNANRLETVEAIEALRRVVLTAGPLEHRMQQLVLLAQLIVLDCPQPARLHAKAALQAGASDTDLAAVAEISLLTAGLPAYGLAIEIAAELVRTDIRTSRSRAWGVSDQRRNWS